MAGSSLRSINYLLSTSSHSVIVCGRTGCGKTAFIMALLEGPYPGAFRHIVVLCPTNKTYKQCYWLWTDPEVFVLDPGERLYDYLRAFYQVFQGEQTLFIIDDCSASEALTKKKDMLSVLAFSGRHADQSVWVLTQKYNAVLKDLLEQTRCLFHYRQGNSGRWCGSSWPRENTQSFCWSDQPAAYMVLTCMK